MLACRHGEMLPQGISQTECVEMDEVRAGPIRECSVFYTGKWHTEDVQRREELFNT